MAGKFKFYFKSGFSMVDRNKIKTLSGAKSFARGHNKSDKDKIIRVEVVKPMRRRPTQRGFFGRGFKI